MTLFYYVVNILRFLEEYAKNAKKNDQLVS